MIRIYLSGILGEKRLSQADLARMTGIRASTINELYHEIASRITIEHLDLICEALGCELSELITHIPGNPTSPTKSRAGHDKDF